MTEFKIFQQIKSLVLLGNKYLVYSCLLLCNILNIYIFNNIINISKLFNFEMRFIFLLNSNLTKYKRHFK